MSAYLGMLLLAAALATGSIWSGWVPYWPHLRGLRRQIAACAVRQEVRFTVTTIEVERASAAIHRPVFTRERQVPQAHSALRAA